MAREVLFLGIFLCILGTLQYDTFDQRQALHHGREPHPTLQLEQPLPAAGVNDPDHLCELPSREAKLLRALSALHLVASHMWLLQMPVRFKLLCPCSLTQLFLLIAARVVTFSSTDASLAEVASSVASVDLVVAMLCVPMLHIFMRDNERCQRITMLRERTFASLLVAESVEKSRAVAQERRVVQMEKDLSAIAWHELKNPLNCLTDLVRCLRDSLSASDFVALHAELALAASGLSHTVESLNNFSLSKGGEQAVSKPTVTNLSEVLQLVASCAAPQLAEKRDSVSLVIELPPEPLWVMVDVCMVRQVVLNLLANAMRLTQSGIVRLRCGERECADSKVEVVIEVADTGPGLLPERCAQLTQRYGLSVEDVGLGLHVVGRLLDCLGSELRATSPFTPGVAKSPGDGPGVALWFELTLDRAEPEAIKSAVRAQSAALPKQLRVLVADDMSLNRRVLKMALRKVRSKWAVDEAVTAEAALQMVRDAHAEGQPYGLIFMDENFHVHLSGGGAQMCGSEAVKLIRADERA